MQWTPVWFPGPPSQPGSARAKGVPRPGSAETWEASVSRGPGSHGAAAVARAAKKWPAGARAISLGLPLLFPPFTAYISPSPPPSFLVAHHSFSSNSRCSSPPFCSYFFVSFLIDSSQPNPFPPSLFCSLRRCGSEHVHRQVNLVPQRLSLDFFLLVTLVFWGTDRFLLISSHT
jgi:hypothetical protein